MFSFDVTLKKIVFVVLLVAAVHYYVQPGNYFQSGREVNYSPNNLTPGELPSADPVQENLGNAAPIHYKNYTITPMANFTITARVLSKENYFYDSSSELSPTDLAMGWGRMSDPAILKKISISQSNRWYHWHVDEFPIPQREIETHSANMHMIPANASVRNTLANVRSGNIVALKGKLVSITRPDGWHWQSSMTREDTGDGACEVIWVEDLYIKP